jgi:protein-tyrosine-phosphatase
VPAPGPAVAADGIVFVCTANSARSQLAAALWNRLSEVHAESAGTHPADRVHPLAVHAGKRAGLDLADARPRSLQDLIERPDLVVTVCDRAHEELERSGGRGRTLHWSVPDPVDVGSTAAFDDAIRDLELRVSTLAPHVVLAPRRVPRRRSTHDRASEPLRKERS